MRDPHPRPLKATARTALLLIMLGTGLWGCGSAPVEPEPEPVAPPPVEEVPEPPRQASLTLPPSAYSSQFTQADQLLNQNRWMAASEALATVPTEGLDLNDRAYLAYLQARTDYIRGDQARALELLHEYDQPDVELAIRYRMQTFQRYMLQLSGAYLQSAKLADELLRIAPDSDIPGLKRAIWQDLQRLDTAQLEQALPEAADAQWRSWLDLALLTRGTALESLQGLPGWVQQNQQHPAANPLPGGLGYLLQQPAATGRVALILPLSGRLAPAGRAVRDGYLASYYAARKQGLAGFDVMILDQDSFESAGTAYDTAVSQGASIVVGPLSKDAVAEISAIPGLPVPVLALNRPEDMPPPQAGSSALVQLSLSPEDEAADIASLAYGQGARNALVIRPQGDWGSKVAQAFITRWTQLGGAVANSVTYSGREDYSATVKEALDIPASEQRAQAVRDMLATAVEFNARRRQDVDAIFLLSSNGAEARSLKPLLAFHYAGNVPVYAISSIYSGRADPRDRDLDGTNLVEIPWLLGADPEVRQAIKEGSKDNNSYTRLHALGTDAFLLQSRFRLLQAGPDALLRGNTGLLSMDPQLRIQRELVLSTFDGGAIRAQ